MLDRPLLLVTGKGGVGRSAVTAAIARARARDGTRVLALAVDRGDGLAAHLGVGDLSPVPVTTSSGCLAGVVDPASAMEEYVRRRVGSKSVAAAARLFHAVATTVPGVRDIVVAGKLAFEATRRPWDCVVVDAPPAGQIVSLFQAPAAIAELVPKGTVHQHAREVGAALADPQITELVIVTAPEELAVTEAEEVDAGATAAGISPVRSRLVNRALADPGFADPPAEPGPEREAALLHLAIRRAQRRILSTVQADLALPLLLGAQTPTDVAAQLAGPLGTT